MLPTSSNTIENKQDVNMAEKSMPQPLCVLDIE